MGFNCGIVGLPNVGKSTIFNAITSAGAESANYPFCTIEPNVGVVSIPDKRMDTLSSIVKPQNVVFNTMEFVDIAGLVEGAAKGEGLGNKFLSHIRSTDAIAHVIRCFDDDNVLHVSNSVNPLRDKEVIELELLYADIESCERQLERTRKKCKSDKALEKNVQLLETYLNSFNNGYPARSIKASEEDKLISKQFQFITDKPIMYICNVSENDINIDNDYVKAIRSIAESDAPVIKICGSIEADISEIENPEEKAEFLADLNISESGLDKMIKAGHKLLGLHTYFTAGVKEVRAWTFRAGMSAPQTAGVIHTDFERGFIKAEVISYDDFVLFKGEQGAKDNGRLRIEGKDYIVNDGDIIHFRFNT
jgi:hypothetical protein